MQYPGGAFVLSVVFEICVALAATAVFWAAWSRIVVHADAPLVDRSTCSCPCWDGAFKNGHSRDTGGTFYKSVFFNVDEQMGHIVMIAVGGVMALHIAVRTTVNLIWNRRIRWCALAGAARECCLEYTAWSPVLAGLPW